VGRYALLDNASTELIAIWAALRPRLASIKVTENDL
jgi:hypothetical protein